MNEQHEQVAGRPLLEVWSHRGTVLEGVFEVSERADADRYVGGLRTGDGTRAKVLELRPRGICSRAADVRRAWDATPFPPVWWVVVRENERTALAVFEEHERDQALAKVRELEQPARVPHEVRAWVHPERPELGVEYGMGGRSGSVGS